MQRARALPQETAPELASLFARAGDAHSWELRRHFDDDEIVEFVGAPHSSAGSNAGMAGS